MSPVQGYRGLILGLGMGLMVAVVVGGVLYGQIAALSSANADLGSQLTNSRRQVANDTSQLANAASRISGLERVQSNLSARIASFRSVLNYSSLRVLWAGNLTIAARHGYGYDVGAPDPGMAKPGYILVVFQGGFVNATTGPIQANMTTKFINRSVTWAITTANVSAVLPYRPPMGGYVEFTNDGSETIWVNYEIAYLA